jgi:signal transduction histidine kinase
MRNPHEDDLETTMAELAAGVAHEVRNPLNAVQINLRILEEELHRLEPDPMAHPHVLLAKIAQEIRSLDNFVAEFLRFARPPSPRLEETSVDDLLKDLGTFLLPQCRKRRVRLVVSRSDSTAPLCIRADAFLFKHALLNLVLNALSACKRNGTITLGARTMDGRVEITVVDDGKGIPADLLPRIFTPFYTTREGGTGLGLPIARRVVEAHGGTLDIESVPEVGTRAVIDLPIARGTAR